MITVEHVMAGDSCYVHKNGSQDEARIRRHLGGGKTLLECLDLRIPLMDRIWLIELGLHIDTLDKISDLLLERYPLRYRGPRV